MSKHYMDLFLKCPALFYEGFYNPKVQSQSDTFLLGSLFHCLLLEPEEATRRYHEKKFSGTTKEGKLEKQLAEKDGKTLVKSEIFQTARNMAETVYRTNFWQNILEGDLQTELSAYWEQDGIQCKARIDGVYEIDGLGRYALDLKSCQDASISACQNAISSFGYHRQAAWYKHAMLMCGYPIEDFIFIFVEKTPPYLSTVCTISQEAEAAAMAEIREMLPRYKACIDSNQWPSYSSEVVEIDLARWAYKDLEERGIRI